MSLDPGQIIGTDLSPNANILGTQIADKTLQFRNFSEDTFKIVKTGTISLPTVSVATGVNQYGKFVGTTVTIPHGLGFVPALLAFVNYPGSYVPLPWTLIDQNTTNSFIQLNYRVTVDATNVYGVSDAFAFNVTATAGNNTIVAKYYLLQETAN